MNRLVKLWLGLILIGMAFGCARGPIITKPRPGAANGKATVAMREYTSRLQWQRSGYYREFEDAVREYPVFLAIAGDGTACIVSGAVWAMWQRQDVVVCSEKWRFLRP